MIKLLKDVYKPYDLLYTESVKTEYHAFVTSRVDYCNSVFSSAPKNVMDK